MYLRVKSGALLSLKKLTEEKIKPRIIKANQIRFSACLKSKIKIDQLAKIEFNF